MLAPHQIKSSMSQWFKVPVDALETERSLSSNFLSAMKKNNLDAILPSHVKRQENNELIRGLAELAKQCLDMCGSNRPSMKEIADELGRLRKLSLHPWVQVDVEMETRSLLGGASTASFEIEGATSTGYPTQEGESLPMNPGSSYYARSRDTQAGGASDEGKLPSSRPATLPFRRRAGGGPGQWANHAMPRLETPKQPKTYRIYGQRQARGRPQGAYNIMQQCAGAPAPSSTGYFVM
uniref:Serine-threonine/tyrosine-protein kinase catalytic domain-containing protein n=1 Tax=Setaria viridis TaxID=4556 RepID=A0A4U6U2H8_SETVI|nr:hypothetical protein SEVIR_6G016300v2 [Setaria viridis]